MTVYHNNNNPIIMPLFANKKKLFIHDPPDPLPFGNDTSKDKRYNGFRGRTS